jgi:hypothetical protein
MKYSPFNNYLLCASGFREETPFSYKVIIVDIEQVSKRVPVMFQRRFNSGCEKFSILLIILLRLFPD